VKTFPYLCIIINQKQLLSMKKETLERLLNNACELLIIFEDSNSATQEDKDKIDAIFNEIKYADSIDNEIRMSADDEVQDFDTFGEHKI
jgi:hypothetical protein